MDQINEAIEVDAQVKAGDIEKSKWTAVVKAVSDVDSGGNMEIIVDYLQDDVVVYPSIQISGTPDNILANTQARGAELKQNKVQAVQIKVGDRINI